jgi:hypothetical protein
MGASLPRERPADPCRLLQPAASSALTPKGPARAFRVEMGFSQASGYLAVAVRTRRVSSITVAPARKVMFAPGHCRSRSTLRAKMSVRLRSDKRCD